MRVAAIQMTSGDSVEANLDAAERLLRAAREDGAGVAALPENFAFMGLRDADKREVAEPEGEGPIQQRIATLARELGLWIVAGTLPLAPRRGERVAAACLVFDAGGARVARYDKIHLFDVDLPGRDESYRESAHVAPGAQPVVIDTPAGRLGLAVCYDVRFPELFRRMSALGAEWFVLPSAFTVPTGEAHWEVLLRARAIENLAPVVAPAQWGRHASGRLTWGHSMIVDHWGRVAAECVAGEGFVAAELDLRAQAEARGRFPALNHRRLPG